MGKTPASTTLAILCGGASTRLGQDKGLYSPLGDECLVARAIRLWGKSFAEILIVTRDEEQASVYRQRDWGRKARVITDVQIPGVTMPRAAIAGVYSALVQASQPTVCLLPVDQLGVRATFLEDLIAEQAPLSCFQTATGEPIPFPMVCHQSLAEKVAARIQAGAFGIMALHRELEAWQVAAGDYGEELEINANRVADMTQYFGEPLTDPFGRRLHYLRFSLTEACNLSCTYCLPDGFPEWYRHKARLKRDDILTMLAGFRRLGFRKVRFTGGEPTVHPGCKDAVNRARKLGFEEIALTTNGLLIKDLAAWRQAGLTHLNVSLDSLDEQEFSAITKQKGAAKIQALVEEAVALGLSAKVNAVLLRSINGTPSAIGKMVDWALAAGVDIRFIELMETKLNGSFSDRERILGTELVPLLEERGLQPRHGQGGLHLGGPAEYYNSPDYPGRVGMINPMSCNFCSKCNRLRVTARGELKMCLFGDANVPLDLSSPEAVALNVRQVIDRKPERHYLEDGNVGNVATFRTIGG